MYKVHSCLIWKTQGVSFNEAIEGSKLNFKVVDIIFSDKHPKILLNLNINLQILSRN